MKQNFSEIFGELETFMHFFEKIQKFIFKLNEKCILREKFRFYTLCSFLVTLTPPHSQEQQHKRRNIKKLRNEKRENLIFVDFTVERPISKCAVLIFK